MSTLAGSMASGRLGLKNPRGETTLSEVGLEEGWTQETNTGFMREPAFLRGSLIFGKYFVFLALQYLACPVGMEVSRSWEVMGQKLTASVSCC